MEAKFHEENSFWLDVLMSVTNCLTSLASYHLIFSSFYRASRMWRMSEGVSLRGWKMDSPWRNLERQSQVIEILTCSCFYCKLWQKSYIGHLILVMNLKVLRKLMLNSFFFLISKYENFRLKQISLDCYVCSF